MQIARRHLWPRQLKEHGLKKSQLHITDGRKATCYPGLEEKMGAAVMTACGAVQDGRVITGRAAGSADEFGLLCLQALKGKAAADQVAADIVYRA